MTDLRKTAKQALQYLESNADADSDWEIMIALRKALEQPEHQAEPLTKERILVLVDAYVEASAKCDHILGHYAQTEFQIAQAKADLAKARATFETAIVAAQPEQEPVAFAAEILGDVNGVLSTRWADWWIPNEGDKLYTTPPAVQRPWVGLTEEDWDKVGDMPDTFDQGAAWAAARLKEKNDH